MEKPITYLELKKLFKGMKCKKAIHTINKAIEAGKTGLVYLYRDNLNAFIVKRYRTDNFVIKHYV